MHPSFRLCTGINVGADTLLNWHTHPVSFIASVNALCELLTEAYLPVLTLIQCCCLHICSNQLIIPWHTMPLTMCDLGRMKLVGLAKPRSLHRAIPASVFRFSTVFDYDSSKLWTPPYRVSIIHQQL